MSEHGRRRGGAFSVGQRSAAWVTLALAVGCTTVAGLDKEYVAESEQGAQGGSAGVAGDGGRSGSAGQGGSGAGGTSVQSCEVTGCGEGKKCCGVPENSDAGIDPNARDCVAPSPTFGCGLADCKACPFPPANGNSICLDGACAIKCYGGFEEQSGACVPDGSGGNGGSAGSAGSGGSGGTGGGAQCTTSASCQGCGFHGPIGCCRKDGSGCGCTWFPTYCW